MSDLLIKGAQPDAAALIQAVADHDQEAVADVLTTLRRDELYALAVVLASYAAPATECADLRLAVAHAANAFGTTEQVVRSISRRREALDARAVAMYVGHLLGVSYSAIGREMGRDHSTVMHACGRVGETPRLRRISQGIARRLGWDPDVLDEPLPMEVGA